MRWKDTEYGKRRQRWFYAYLPYHKNREWRWLEAVHIEEMYSARYAGNGKYTEDGYVFIRFLN